MQFRSNQRELDFKEIMKTNSALNGVSPGRTLSDPPSKVDVND